MMGKPSSHTGATKQTWTSRLSNKLKPSKGAKSVEPIDQKLALARSLELEGKTAEAIYTYSTILAKGTRADVHHRLAVLHDKGGNFQASEEHYRKALKLDAKNAELLCDRGYSFMLQGRLEDAQSHLDKAIKRNPDLSRAHNNLGLLLAQQGHIDRALVEFAAAGCSHAEARTNLAYALMIEGKVTDAEHHLEIARQADTHLRPAGELESALRQMTLGKAPETNSQQLHTASRPKKSHVGRSNETLKTVPTEQLIELFNQQALDTPPNSEPYRVASTGQFDNRQITAFHDIPPTLVVESATDQRSSQLKQEQIQASIDQRVELPQPIVRRRSTDNDLSFLEIKQLIRPAEQTIGFHQPIQLQQVAKQSSSHVPSELMFKQ